MNTVLASVILAALLAVPAAIFPTAAPAQAAPAQRARASWPIDAAVRLADWQLARMEDAGHVSRATDDTSNPRAWEQAAFWIGMTELADAGAPPRVRAAVLHMGQANGWRPGDKMYFADDLAITQPYLWAATHGAAAAGPTRTRFDAIITKPAVTTLAFYMPPEGCQATECLTRWCWCDALFIAPPAFVALSGRAGDPKYVRFAMKEFWATTDFLLDPVEHLYYRDSRFFERRDDKGRKQFWSRGNGWVIAAMVRIIPHLAAGSPDRRRMEGLFVEMAGRLRMLQKADGYWAPSLLAPGNAPPESSGTGFFTYGMAWGVEAGLLPRAEYEPTVRRGWAALNRAIQPDGRLGYVQQVSDRPETVNPQETQYYGVGASLLTATAIARLDARR